MSVAGLFEVRWILNFVGSGIQEPPACTLATCTISVLANRSSSAYSLLFLLPEGNENDEEPTVLVPLVAGTASLTVGHALAMIWASLDPVFGRRSNGLAGSDAEPGMYELAHGRQKKESEGPALKRKLNSILYNTRYENRDELINKLNYLTGKESGAGTGLPYKSLGARQTQTLMLALEECSFCKPLGQSNCLEALHVA
jgi:hypothetical protein